MTDIVHLSDLHFGAEDPMLVEALIADLGARPPDLVAISGDLTQGARRGEFRAARAFIDRLPAPVLAVPGNHDITPYVLPERFLDPYLRWHAAIGPETEPGWQDGRVAVIGLNTARRFGLHWDWSRGRVTGARLARLKARLEALPAGLTRVVVAHHPLLAPAAAPETTVAGGAAAALAEFARLGVALVLSGHLHQGSTRLYLPGGQGPLMVQGSTTTSTRLRGEPNAYHRITIGTGPPVVATRVWDGTVWRDEPAQMAQPSAGPRRLGGERRIGDAAHGS
jgi:3',5'-cyclic AMP phosphodiesterase CpdA